MPTISGSINAATIDTDSGYYYESMFWAVLVFFGLISSVVLYIVDKRDGGILDRVDKGTGIAELLTSPKPEERRTIADNAEM